jgi:hypothetical protein
MLTLSVLLLVAGRTYWMSRKLKTLQGPNFETRAYTWLGALYVPCSFKLATVLTQALPVLSVDGGFLYTIFLLIDLNLRIVSSTRTTLFFLARIDDCLSANHPLPPTANGRRSLHAYSKYEALKDVDLLGLSLDLHSVSRDRRQGFPRHRGYDVRNCRSSQHDASAGYDIQYSKHVSAGRGNSAEGVRARLVLYRF